MTLKVLLCLALVWSGRLLDGEPATHHQPQTSAHNWGYITFPWRLPEDKQRPDFMVGWPGCREHSDEIPRGVRLDIMNIAQGFRFLKTNAVTTLLHRANGEVVEPTAEGKELLNHPVSTSWAARLPDGEFAPQLTTYFPWGTNTLEEAWIEVSIGPERYWLEIPYGFDRNPADPLLPSRSGGPPQFAPAMKPMTGHDHIVRWQNVHYGLDSTQNGELSLIQANPSDAKSEVDLYEFPKNQNLFSPHTDVRVVDADGTVINGRCVNLHLDDNHLRRTDTFDFGRHGDELRCWGEIEIKVDDKKYRVLVPSSLYKYTHGHTPRDEK
jgi:hypothetical protein